MFQFIDHVQKVARRASDPVKRRDQYNVELPPTRIIQHRVEAGTTSLRTAHSDIGVLRDYGVAALLSKLAQVVKLGLDVLIRGADSSIDRAFLHPMCSLTLFNKMGDGSTMERRRPISDRHSSMFL